MKKQSDPFVSGGNMRLRMSDPRLIGVLSSKVSVDTQCSSNIVGGIPLVPNGWQSPKCESCHEEMTFLLRIDAPVGVNISNRMLYMFICCRRHCLESEPSHCFVLLRYQIMKEKSIEKDDGRSAIDLDEWHFDGADDWGGDYDLEEEIKPKMDDRPPDVSTQEDVVTEIAFHRLASSDDTVTFNGYYIDVFEDTKVAAKEESKTLTCHERELLQAYYGDDVDKHVEDLYCEAVMEGNSSEKEDVGEDEEDVNSKIMTKFVQCLSSYPSQVIRYQWAGSPLIAEPLPKPPHESHTCCRNCGATSVFEFQITPGLFAQLSSDRENACELMRSVSIATVLVFSCSECCWEKGRIEGKREQCLVQMETVENEKIDDD